MAREDFQRKLTAILGADVVGYSRLMGKDEEATVRTLNKYKEMIFRLIKQHRGRLVDSPGDNVLAEFVSVVDAVKCAVHIQKDLKESNEELPPDRKMEFRIGINTGDVIQDGNRIYGDGVNVSARIESLADPGGICVSRTAYDQVKKKLKVEYEYLGEYEVKNIDEPVRVYKVLIDSIPNGLIQDERSKKTMPIERGAYIQSDKPSIAVLPFVNISGDPEQEYFSDGMTEELINALANLEGLRVISRTSSFFFKGKDVDLPTVCEKLNVDNVIEGSVRKAGNALRISTQLVHVADDRHIWSETYDRELKDIFKIQENIANNVADKLRLALGIDKPLRLRAELQEEDKEKVIKRYTENQDALNLYLKGRYFWNRRFQGDMIKAVNFYQKAIDKDPDYVLPYVGIANVFNILGEWAFIHPKEAYMRSKAMLQKALDIDSFLSEAYSSLAFMIHGYEWDFGTAERYLKRSIELNPNNPYAHGWYGEMLATYGRNDQALEEAKKAIESDPLFSLIHALLGVVLAFSGLVDEGREQILKAIAMDPDQPMPYLFLGMIYLMKPAIPEKAIETLQKSASFGMTFALGWMGAAYALAGQREEAIKILDRMNSIAKERYISPLKKILMYLRPGLKHFRFMKKKYVAPLMKALIYLALNMKDEALESLEKAAQVRDYFFPTMIIGIDVFDIPLIEEIRTHPRFKALEKKIKTG